MKLNTKKLTDVFKFTAIQLIKGRPFKVSAAIILVLTFIGGLLINFIPNMAGGKEQGGKLIESSIKTVYYNVPPNDSTYIFNTLGDLFKDTKFESTKDNKDTLMEKIKNTKEGIALLTLRHEANRYSLELYVPKDKSVITLQDAQSVLSVVSGALNRQRLSDAGLTPNKIDDVTTPIETKVTSAGEEDNSAVQQIVKYILPTVLLILVFYIIYFYGYWVASSIVSEKSTRITEFLLTSIKPLDLLIGKCAAMGSLALAQFLSIIITFLVSVSISDAVVKNIKGASVKTLSPYMIFSELSVFKILVILLFFILGYVVYSLFNALVGATISKIEDLNMAIMPVSFASIIGYLISTMGLMANSSGLSRFALFFPLSSPFYVPAAILNIDLKALDIVISFAILMALIVLFAVFTAKVYSVVILHTGNRLGFKDLFKIYNSEK